MAPDRVDKPTPREFIDTVRKLPQITDCPNCGSLMEQRRATLTSWHTGESWHITFPLCDKCDPTQ
jgi:hypothetical protein